MIKEVLRWRCEEEEVEEKEERPQGLHSTQLTQLPPAGGASRCNNKGGKREIKRRTQPCFQTKIKPCQWRKREQFKSLFKSFSQSTRCCTEGKIKLFPASSSTQGHVSPLKLQELKHRIPHKGRTSFESWTPLWQLCTIKHMNK